MTSGLRCAGADTTQSKARRMQARQGISSSGKSVSPRYWAITTFSSGQSGRLDLPMIRGGEIKFCSFGTFTPWRPSNNYLLAVPKYLCFFFSRDRGALSKSAASASAATRGGRGGPAGLTRVSPHLLLLHCTTMIGKNKAEEEFYHHCTTPKPEQRRPGIDVLLASHILPLFLLSHTEPASYRRRCKQQVQEAQKIKPLSADQYDISHLDELPD
jgi:hypothetical protein